MTTAIGGGGRSKDDLNQNNNEVEDGKNADPNPLTDTEWVSFIQTVQLFHWKIACTLFFFGLHENNALQETSSDKNETDEARPIEKWGKSCKAKLAIINE